MSRNRKRRPEHRRDRVAPQRFVVAAAVGLLCQLVFLFSYQTALAAYHTRRAKQAVGADRDAAAVEHATRALDLDTHQGYAAYFAGQAQRQLGRPAQAAESVRHALRTMAHRGQALRELAMCEKALDESKAETANLAEALAIAPLAPGNAALRARLGQLRFGQGRWAAGTAWFRSIVAEEPQARFAFDGLAVGHTQLGFGDGAVAAALGLLGSERLLPRARDHLLRLSQARDRRQTITSMLSALLREYGAGDPRRQAIASLLREIADQPAAAEEPATGNQQPATDN